MVLKFTLVKNLHNIIEKDDEKMPKTATIQPEVTQTITPETTNIEKEDTNMNQTVTTWEEEQRLEQEIKEKLRGSKEVHWSFSPATPVIRDGKVAKYDVTISAYELATLYEEGTLIIASNVQRGQRMTPSGKLKDIANQKHINEMFANVMKGRMYGGTIILNSTTPIKLNNDEDTISGSTPLQIIDGGHRTRMCVKWKKFWKKNPEIYKSPKDYQFSVSIEQLSNEEDAKALFAEANSYSLKVNKTRTSFLDVTNYANQIAQRIMNESDLKNKVETVSTTIRATSSNLITFGVLVSAIKANYSPQTKQEQEDIINYLVNFIDKLISIFPKFMANSNLEERNTLKKQYFTIEPLAWTAYFALSKALYGQEDWAEKLNKLNTHVQFSGWEGDFLNRSNPIFRKVLREDTKIVNTTGSIKWVNTVFTKFIAEDKTLDQINEEG